jgi:hypothetical protein
MKRFSFDAFPSTAVPRRRRVECARAIVSRHTRLVVTEKGEFFPL